MSAKRRGNEPKGDGVTGFPFDASRTGSWKISLPCSKAEAERIAEGDLPEINALDPQPTLMTSEPDPDKPEAWQLDAYVEDEPGKALIAIIAALAPSTKKKPTVTHIPEEDWVTLSQAGLEPIRAGRFFVHTPHNAEGAPRGMTGFVIDAGRAFGTGHHETTTGCLEMLDRLRVAGRRFDDIVDVGTGTGLLAFAARALWPAAKVIASDIDPVSIEVTAENAALNDVPVGRGRGQVELVVAPGLSDRRLRDRAPYDLLIANILAGPLIELAPVFADAVLPGGTVVLAGLLDTQADAVTNAYRREGLYLTDSILRGDWRILRMAKRRR